MDIGFYGWTDTLSSETPKYSPGATFSENKNVTLYAVWVLNTENCTLTFDANGGTNAPKSITRPRDSIINIPLTEPVRSNLVFLGWSEDKDAVEATYKKNERYTLSANKTFYAVWEDTEMPIVTIEATEKDKQWVLHGSAKDNGGITGYLWSNELYSELNQENIPWVSTGGEKASVAVDQNVTKSGIYYFYVKDIKNNVEYQSIEVYELNFIVDGVKKDTKYKVSGYATDISELVPRKALYVFVGWQPATEERVYMQPDRYVIDKSETFTALWEEAVAHIPSTDYYYLSTQDAVDDIPTNCTNYVLVRLIKDEETDGVTIRSGQMVSYETGDKVLTSAETTVNVLSRR